MSDPVIDPGELEENERLERAIALSLTSPEVVPIQQPVPARAARNVRFNLPILDPPVRTAPRMVPVVPRLRSVRFRPPPAPIMPKPIPPPPTTREQRMSATMRFSQSTGQRPASANQLPELRAPGGFTHDRPEITPEPDAEPGDSDVESFVSD